MVAAVAGTPQYKPSWLDTPASQTLSYTLDAAATKLVVFVMTRDDTSGVRTVSGVTWNGVSMVASTANDDGARTRTQMFYLDLPDTGTHDVVVTQAGATRGTFVVYGLSGVPPGAGEATATVSYDGTSPDSAVVTGTTADAMVLCGVYLSSATGPISAATGTGTISDINAGGSYLASSGGSVTMSWAYTAVFEGTGVAISFAPGSMAIPATRIPFTGYIPRRRYPI